jgi:hypothetical protein
VWLVVAPWVLATAVAAPASIEITLVVAVLPEAPVTLTAPAVMLNVPPTWARVEPLIVA